MQVDSYNSPTNPPKTTAKTISEPLGFSVYTPAGLYDLQ